MKRLTKKINDIFVVDAENINIDSNGYTGKAIDRLASFENVVEKLLMDQDEISKELGILRDRGQTKSYRFRQLLGHKLTNSALITLLESHHLM